MLDFRQSLINNSLHKVLKRLHYPFEVMLTCVGCYVAYPLSLRRVAEIMPERGVFVDHNNVHRWLIKMLPVLAAVFRWRKRPVGSSWRLDESCIKLSGQWKYLYSAVDRDGKAVNSLHTARRDLAVARRFLQRAINLHGVSEKITIVKSSADKAAIESVKVDAGVDIVMRQSKHLNNIVEQDHRAVKKVTGPVLGFKSFWSAQKLIFGIETMHMIKKARWTIPKDHRCPQQISSIAWPFDRGGGNATSINRTPLTRQNLKSACPKNAQLPKLAQLPIFLERRAQEHSNLERSGH